MRAASAATMVRMNLPARTAYHLSPRGAVVAPRPGRRRAPPCDARASSQHTPARPAPARSLGPGPSAKVLPVNGVADDAAGVDADDDPGLPEPLPGRVHAAVELAMAGVRR